MIQWINRKRNKKGFTLIELIVVIAILGILAAIAIPRLAGFRETASEQVADANEKLVNNTIQIYLASEDGFPATVTDFEGLIDELAAKELFTANIQAELKAASSWDGTLPSWAAGDEVITR